MHEGVFIKLTLHLSLVAFHMNLSVVCAVLCCFVRESHQFWPAVGGLEPQPGDLWHHQRDGWRVRLHHLQFSRRRLPLSVLWTLVLFFRPKDAAKALKKRIVGNKNFREVMLALTVSVCYITSSAGPRVCVCVRSIIRRWCVSGSWDVCEELRPAFPCARLLQRVCGGRPGQGDTAQKQPTHDPSRPSPEPHPGEARLTAGVVSAVAPPSFNAPLCCRRGPTPSGTFRLCLEWWAYMRIWGGEDWSFRWRIWTPSLPSTHPTG